MLEGLTFSAILQGIRSTTDGGWRVTLDVAQDDTRQILQLAQLRDQLLQVGVVPVSAQGGAGSLDGIEDLGPDLSDDDELSIDLGDGDGPQED